MRENAKRPGISRCQPPVQPTRLELGLNLERLERDEDDEMTSQS